MTTRDRAALAKLAAIASYSDEHLTLIAEANMPRYRRGDELTDTQVASLYSAAETCYESGLRGAAVAATIQHHRQSSAPDWRNAFWHERIRRAGELEALPAAPEPQPLAPPPIPVPALNTDPAGGLGAHAAPQPANVTAGTADHHARATAMTAPAVEIPIALGAHDAADAAPPGPIPPEPVVAQEPAGMPATIEPQTPPPADPKDGLATTVAPAT